MGILSRSSSRLKNEVTEEDDSKIKENEDENKDHRQLDNSKLSCLENEIRFNTVILKLRRLDPVYDAWNVKVIANECFKGLCSENKLEKSPVKRAKNNETTIITDNNTKNDHNDSYPIGLNKSDLLFQKQDDNCLLPSKLEACVNPRVVLEDLDEISNNNCNLGNSDEQTTNLGREGEEITVKSNNICKNSVIKDATLCKVENANEVPLKLDSDLGNPGSPKLLGNPGDTNLSTAHCGEESHEESSDVQDQNIFNIDNVIQHSTEPGEIEQSPKLCRQKVVKVVKNFERTLSPSSMTDSNVATIKVLFADENVDVHLPTVTEVSKHNDFSVQVGYDSSVLKKSDHKYTSFLPVTRNQSKENKKLLQEKRIAKKSLHQDKLRRQSLIRVNKPTRRRTPANRNRSIKRIFKSVQPVVRLKRLSTQILKMHNITSICNKQNTLLQFNKGLNNFVSIPRKSDEAERITSEESAENVKLHDSNVSILDYLNLQSKKVDAANHLDSSSTNISSTTTSNNSISNEYVDDKSCKADVILDIKSINKICLSESIASNLTSDESKAKLNFVKDMYPDVCKISTAEHPNSTEIGTKIDLNHVSYSKLSTDIDKKLPIFSELKADNDSKRPITSEIDANIDSKNISVDLSCKIHETTPDTDVSDSKVIGGLKSPESKQICVKSSISPPPSPDSTNNLDELPAITRSESANEVGSTSEKHLLCSKDGSLPVKNKNESYDENVSQSDVTSTSNDPPINFKVPTFSIKLRKVTISKNVTVENKLSLDSIKLNKVSLIDSINENDSTICATLSKKIPNCDKPNDDVKNKSSVIAPNYNLIYDKELGAVRKSRRRPAPYNCKDPRSTISATLSKKLPTCVKPKDNQRRHSIAVSTITKEVQSTISNLQSIEEVQSTIAASISKKISVCNELNDNGKAPNYNYIYDDELGAVRKSKRRSAPYSIEEALARRACKRSVGCDCNLHAKDDKTGKLKEKESPNLYNPVFKSDTNYPCVHDNELGIIRKSRRMTARKLKTNKMSEIQQKVVRKHQEGLKVSTYFSLISSFLFAQDMISYTYLVYIVNELVHFVLFLA